MSRFLDLILVLVIATIFLIPSIFIAVLIKLTSKGPILYWSKRVGKNNNLFLMPKFRTMKINTPDIATHELQNPDKFITSIGYFLRKTSLDEITQVYSIFIGDMRLVGPRPALYNQYDLIELRTQKGIDQLKPGITGWAQVNGRDDLSIQEKVKYDEEYLIKASLSIDIYIIWLTIIKSSKKEGISH
tara:strand:- start:463 stop:1023 length:561 start_codon:yes stop_codon:yes gene_type:complete